MITSAPGLSELIPPQELAQLRALAQHSHAVITEHQDSGGAYPAAPTFSAYRGYAWLRDGSFTAEGISRYGDVASAERFHDWVDRVLRGRRAQVDELRAAVARGETPPVESMLPTRFTFDGQDGSDPWWDFQTDGYGMWLWAVVTHARRHGLDLERWRGGIDVAVDYLVAFWDRACYDWWEEHVEHRHVSTLGAIHAGLVAVGTPEGLEVAASIRSLVDAEGVVDGHLTKWLGSAAVDGSLPACVVPFGLVAPGTALAVGTLAAVARDLDADGGVHRFTADVFYGGGQWILLSALLGWNLAAAGDTAGALRHLRWIAEQADEQGDLPEQVPHHLLHPGSRDEWIARWGTVATPLLWSHGMYLILADELGIMTQRGNA
ncbi:glycosyl hydrolase family 15 [Kribbella sp. VKM Ac-2527]|uniref:Glycosyl hydrolase family 15 n=1 Tax=Kribbella caucasensis TaxID=2512215 RepID=A0A4R6K967_9ACTN|nr:glycoside hydrolase family 15 protein [Kribbella sp. VKM Ac-2527]TDO46342.1 glycosyl hydrolase family 15 [Kribbella sp. VKM Ac-2527]